MQWDGWLESFWTIWRNLPPGFTSFAICPTAHSAFVRCGCMVTREIYFLWPIDGTWGWITEITGCSHVDGKPESVWRPEPPRMSEWIMSSICGLLHRQRPHPPAPPTHQLSPCAWDGGTLSGTMLRLSRAARRPPKPAEACWGLPAECQLLLLTQVPHTCSVTRLLLPALSCPSVERSRIPSPCQWFWTQTLCRIYEFFAYVSQMIYKVYVNSV